MLKAIQARSSMLPKLSKEDPLLRGVEYDKMMNEVTTSASGDGQTPFLKGIRLAHCPHSSKLDLGNLVDIVL